MAIEWLCYRWPWVTPNHPKHSSFCILRCLSYLRSTGKHRDFKFGGHVDHIKSQPTDDKSSLKAAWSRHVTNFKFLVPL